MRKIINGVLYDTEKAQKIASVEHQHTFFGDVDDNDHETLYRGKNSNYFLEKKQPMGTNYYNEIVPIIREDALEWATKNLSVDEALKHFDEMIEEA